MSRRMHVCIICAVLAVLFGGCASHPLTAGVSLSELGDFYSGEKRFKADPYIRAAEELQSLGRSAALRRLHEMARDRASGHQTVMLCRMLFACRTGPDFRGPALGQPAFLGGSEYADWLLQPIEIIDGVPFLIVRGYKLDGFDEQADSYLRYCEALCNWSKVRYAAKTEQQKRDALNKLLASSKWQVPLSAYEVTFFMNQIE